MTDILLLCFVALFVLQTIINFFVQRKLSLLEKKFNELFVQTGMHEFFIEDCARDLTQIRRNLKKAGYEVLCPRLLDKND